MSRYVGIEGSPEPGEYWRKLFTGGYPVRVEAAALTAKNGTPIVMFEFEPVDLRSGDVVRVLWKRSTTAWR